MIIFGKRGQFDSAKENFRAAYQGVRMFGVHERRGLMSRLFRPTAFEKLERAIGEDMCAAAAAARKAKAMYGQPVLAGHHLALQFDRLQAANDEEIYRTTTDERLKGRILQNQLHRLLHPGSRYPHPLAY